MCVGGGGGGKLSGYIDKQFAYSNLRTNVFYVNSEQEKMNLNV